MRVDSSGALRNLVPTKRWVSSALTKEQSKQLIGAFYLLFVEQVQDEALVRALSLILFHYAKERGYIVDGGRTSKTPSTLGTETPSAVFETRPYAPHNLPEGAERALLEDGTLRTRGSKGFAPSA